MEQPSSSSKVTVEYFDPYGVYQLLSPGLLPRLPLRNLHWNSHAGPLRSISALHIDLVPSDQQLTPLSSLDSTSTSTANLSRVKSEDSTASGDDGFRTQALGQAAAERPDSYSGPPKPLFKERRHQIPGLRQTPYLKVFFLRCDDNETYKTQGRRQVREWIKEYTTPSQSTTNASAQENHDAFEWLIVHVIVPNTAAATQPRTSGKSPEGSSGSTTEKSGPRWRGGGSTTILEKLRSDFNGSSKSAVDRIAQIRIGVNDVPYDMLPRVVPAIPGSYTETKQENENAWLDLVSKFKERILTSFDLRVSQYEEDIREKDAQRTWPGWNFCTFFVLKEGLARGFESVGLVEDALVGYDELAVGLDAIIREQSETGSGAAHGGSFLPYTQDLKDQVEQARTAIMNDMGAETGNDDPIDLQSTGDASANAADEIPLNAQKKRYRELILSNDISIFDFRCYLFLRQLSSLLRLANAWSSQEELLAKLKEQRESSLQGVAARLPASQPTDDVENLESLGEICNRSMEFIASIARFMRADIYASQVASQKRAEDEGGEFQPQSDPIMVQAVDNIVSSFTFSVAQQILAQTSTKSLPIPPSTLAPPGSKTGSDGQEPKAAIPEPKTMMHPARKSSLAIRSSPQEPPNPEVFPGRQRANVPDQEGSVSSTFLKAGLERLAAQRAELYLLSRSALEQAGKKHGWSVGWDQIAHLQYDTSDDMENVDLNGKSSAESGKDIPTIPPSSHGVDNKLLWTALNNVDDFYRLYETLTDKALRHYTVANHVKAMQTSMTDLAVLKYHLQDYAAAASYFYRIESFYGESGWAQIELSMLVMYTECLKQLQRKEEYVRFVLRLLSKVAMREKEKNFSKHTMKVGLVGSFNQEEIVPTEPYLDELLQIATTLQHEVHVPLQTFFGHVEIEDTPTYHPNKDSFGLEVRLRYLLQGRLTIEKAKVKITSVGEDTNREIWLETEGPVLVKPGNVRLVVQSNAIIPGTYLVSSVSLHASNLTLNYVHENIGPAFSSDDRFFKCPKLLIYHRPEAFDARLFASRCLHLDRNRSLEIHMSSGWNDVTSGELHVRAATAGLRLQTSEVEVVKGSLQISKNSEAGVVRFGSMASGSIAKLRIPFNLEHEVNDISIKLEISYSTDNGDFFFAENPTVSIMLPIGVNVQDVFKHNALFSKFTISSATKSPLRLLNCQLNNSEVFEAQCGVAPARPVVIFPRQPASMLYRITKLPSQNPGTRNAAKASLSLILHYVCLEEEIENVVTQALHQTLEDTPLYPYAPLVIPAVLTELRSRLSPYDLEKTAIMSEVSTSTLTAVTWQDHFSGLGRTEETHDIAALLAQKLARWQQETPSIQLLPLSTGEETIPVSRSIIIPVEIPSMTVVHTADLRLLDISSVPGNMAVATSNLPISAMLNIKWTRIWDTESQSESDSSSQLGDLEFVYEVSGAADTWLIGGKRKGHFKIGTAQEHQQKLSLPVVLIPLREGSLPFPNVEIKPAPTLKILRPGTPSAEESSTTQAQQRIVTCETDFKNAGETIRVISDARKTTVSLDASGPHGGAWLLESERRSVEDGSVMLG